KNLPSALSNPSGLLSGLGSILGGQGGSSLSQIAGSLLQQFAPQISSIIDKVTGWLNIGSKVGTSADGVLNAVNGFLGNFGVNPDFINNISQRLEAAINGLQGLTNILQGIGGLVNGGIPGSPAPLRA